MIANKIPTFDKAGAYKYIADTRHLICRADAPHIRKECHARYGIIITPKEVGYMLRGQKNPNAPNGERVFAQDIRPEVFAIYREIMALRIAAVKSIETTIALP